MRNGTTESFRSRKVQFQAGDDISRLKPLEAEIQQDYLKIGLARPASEAMALRIPTEIVHGVGLSNVEHFYLFHSFTDKEAELDKTL